MQSTRRVISTCEASAAFSRGGHSVSKRTCLVLRSVVDTRVRRFIQGLRSPSLASACPRVLRSSWTSTDRFLVFAPTDCLAWNTRRERICVTPDVPVEHRSWLDTRSFVRSSLGSIFALRESTSWDDPCERTFADIAVEIATLHRGGRRSALVLGSFLLGCVRVHPRRRGGGRHPGGWRCALHS